MEEMKSKLLAKGFKIDRLDQIEIVSLNPSGRVNKLEIKNADNSLVISAKDFRQALGPNLIRSTNFTLKIISDKIYFTGLGWATAWDCASGGCPSWLKAAKI